MPKLLMVTTVASTLRFFLLPYARHFRGLGWRVDALARDVASDAGCLEAFDACYSLAFSRKPWELRGIREMAQAIRSIVSRGDYDIVHVHTPVASFVTRMALRKRKGRPKVVYTAHGFHFYRGGPWLKNLAYRTLERRAARWTDHLVVINDEDYRAARFHFPIRQGSVTLMPGIGLDLRQWNREAVQAAQAEEDVREELGLGPGDKLFLMAAEFNPGKRHRDALQALAMTGHRDFHLALAGEGALMEETQRLSRKLGIAPQVHFLGVRGDIPRLMLASLATVLPSEREGLSRSVMESIALGVPVLGADARGIRDLIQDPSRGSLYPIGRPAALAAAMLALANDPPKGRPSPDPAWDIQNLLRLHEALYTRILRGD